MSNQHNAEDPLNFTDVLRQERNFLGKADDAALSGLALSGGGIRSATFNLGVLQALAQARLLRTFDYLSTVSGGGYIGSWLSAWIRRANGVANVEAMLGAEDEPAPVKHLRGFSNFLTPKRGMLGPDTQAWVATYLRNLILNLAILLSVFAAVLLVPYLVVCAFRALRVIVPQLGWGLDCAIFLLLLAAVGFTSVNLAGWSPSSANALAPWYLRRKAIAWLIIAPTCAALWLTLVGVERLSAMSMREAAAVGALTYAGLWLYGGLLQWVAVRFFSARAAATPSTWAPTARDYLSPTVRVLIIAFAAAAGAAGGALFSFAAKGAAALSVQGVLYPVMAVSLGFPLLLACAALTVVLHIGLVGRGFSSSYHLEWWARLGAWTVIFAIAWIALFALALFGPAFTAIIGAWARKTVSAGWLLSTLAGVLLGKSSFTGGEKSNRWLELFVRATPYVFILGLLLLLSYALSTWLFGPLQSQAPFAASVLQRAEAIADTPWHRIAAPFAGLLLGAVVLAGRVNVNLFSLYHAYRMRLIRAYLGASNRDRNPQPFTDFDRNDDVHLPELQHTLNGTAQRPLHIINTALNLVRVQNKAWQQRKSAAFALTPLHVGYSLDAPLTDGYYRPTGEYATQGYHARTESFSLGSALTISGAAATPNMGYHSSPGMTFLLAVFNIRLGRWCPNPREDKWRQNEPKVGLGYLLMELLGLTDSRSNFVYLSDGGHFENLGLYELVRRRCRYIVASDCGTDSALAFDDLANAQRKCAADLGVNIDIDVSALRRQADGFSRANYAVGRILYGHGEPEGTLVFIKPALTGREPIDVLNYTSVEKNFPQVSTLDQWFDESQFESYRRLGYFIAARMLSEQTELAARLMALQPGR